MFIACRSHQYSCKQVQLENAHIDSIQRNLLMLGLEFLCEWISVHGFLSQYITFSIKPWVLFKEGDIDFRKNLINSVCPFRLGTDILFGNNCGLKTILVLTGISSLADVNSVKTSSNPDHKNSIPDFYMPGIEALRLPLKSFSKASSWL